MPADHARLDELRRRVDTDPASIAFASLAEELRKAGEHAEAVRVCRAGLEHHPTYLSARVTLGRALMELQEYPEARTELEYVLHAAPDNLIALKSMGELKERTGDSAGDPAAAEPPATARAVEPPPPEPRSPLSFAAPPAPAPVAEPPAPSPPPAPAAPPPDPVLEELEGWQQRINADRVRRGSPSLDR